MIFLRADEKLSQTDLHTLYGKIKALIYVRVSSDDQARHGYSLESQIERCAELARNKFQYRDENMMVLIEAGERGDNPDRPMINYVLELLQRGVGQKVFFLHPDRMSRYLYLQMEISARIWDLGCDMEFVEFELVKENPESMLMFNIQGSIAQYNKAKILANTKRGRRAKALKGQMVGMRRLYGYSFDKKEDRLIEEPQEKAVYLMMVDWLLNGKRSCSAIARELSSRGVPAPNGRIWYQATISRILKNEAYTGTYYYGKTEVIQTKGKAKISSKEKEEWIAIPIPAYIDKATYDLIQGRLSATAKSSAGRPSARYLLKGLVRCGRCDGAVTSGVTTRTKTRKLTYYCCTAKSPKGYPVGGPDPSRKLCRGRNWRTDQVDDLVWLEIVKMLDAESIVKTVARDQAETSELDELRKKQKLICKTIQERNHSREKYIDLYAEGIIKSKDDLHNRTGRIDRQLEVLHRDLRETNARLSLAGSPDVNGTDRVVNYTSQFNTLVLSSGLAMEDKRALVNLLVERAVLHDNGEVSLTLSISESTHKKLIRRQSDGRSQKSVCAHPGRLS